MQIHLIHPTFDTDAAGQFGRTTVLVIVTIIVFSGQHALMSVGNAETNIAV